MYTKHFKKKKKKKDQGCGGFLLLLKRLRWLACSAMRCILTLYSFFSFHVSRSSFQLPELRLLVALSLR